jgi:hypothetical protein
MGARIKSSLGIAYSLSFFSPIVIIFLVFSTMIVKEQVTNFLGGFQVENTNSKVITVNKNLNKNKNN